MLSVGKPASAAMWESTPTMPVGPSYWGASMSSSSRSSSVSEVRVTGIGRVWGTSASREPSMITKSTSRAVACSSSSAVNARHR